MEHYVTTIPAPHGAPFQPPELTLSVFLGGRVLAKGVPTENQGAVCHGARCDTAQRHNHA